MKWLVYVAVGVWTATAMADEAAVGASDPTDPHRAMQQAAIEVAETTPPRAQSLDAAHAAPGRERARAALLRAQAHRAAIAVARGDGPGQASPGPANGQGLVRSAHGQETAAEAQERGATGTTRAERVRAAHPTPAHPTGQPIVVNNPSPPKP